MTLPPVPDSAVVIAAPVTDWRAAVHAAADALVASGSALPGYGDEMVRMIDEHGPYVVIAPGLALAHARPDDLVLRDGLAVVTLAAPVAFGHPHNDPVSVVLGLAVGSVGGHLESIADIANVFNDASVIPALAGAASADEVRQLLGAPASADGGRSTPEEGSP
ncbi:PTS sugar transporter subunit IIA [Frigoribacterium endophyticum]|uniref:PTS sugar transporter subunit IIA n=1 Tax=Frigoribacterium endophyticum TaxID=1522176 RepID=UPI001421C3EB|nr:PTS system ascorbate-specific IIA component [Frigoribacterium endophyticum]